MQRDQAQGGEAFEGGAPAQAPSRVLKRAVSYLERVKRTFAERPEVYRAFLAVMHAFKEQRYLHSHIPFISFYFFIFPSPNFILGPPFSRFYFCVLAPLVGPPSHLSQFVFIFGLSFLLTTANPSASPDPKPFFSLFGVCACVGTKKGGDHGPGDAGVPAVRGTSQPAHRLQHLPADRPLERRQADTSGRRQQRERLGRGATRAASPAADRHGLDGLVKRHHQPKKERKRNAKAKPRGRRWAASRVLSVARRLERKKREAKDEEESGSYRDQEE